MEWLVEYQIWNEKTQQYDTHEEWFDKWDLTVKFFMEYVTGPECGNCTVTCYWGGKPYQTDDPVVLFYHP